MTESYRPLFLAGNLPRQDETDVIRIQRPSPLSPRTRFSGRPLFPEPSRSISFQEDRRFSYLEPTSQREFRISEVSLTDIPPPVQRVFPARQEQAELNPTSSYRPQSPSRVPPKKRSRNKCCLSRPNSKGNVPRPSGKINYQDDATQTPHVPTDFPSRRDYFLEVEDLEPQSSCICAQEDKLPFYLEPVSSRKFRIFVGPPTTSATPVQREIPIRQEQAELSPASLYRSHPSRTVRPTRSTRKCDPSCPCSNRMVPRSSGKIKYQDDATQTSHKFANVPSRRDYFIEVEALEPQGQLSSVSAQHDRRTCYLELSSLTEFQISEASPTSTAIPLQRELPIRQEQAGPSPTSSYTSQPSSTVRRTKRRRKCCLFRPTSNKRVPRLEGKMKYQDDATQTSHMFSDVPSRILGVENLEPQGQLSSISPQDDSRPCYLQPASLREFHISEATPAVNATPVQRELPVRQGQSELSPTRSYRPQPFRTVQPTRSKCNPPCPGSNRIVPRSPRKIKYQDDATRTSRMFVDDPSSRDFREVEDLEPQGQLSSIRIQDDRQAPYLQPTSLREFRICEASPTATATPVQRELPVIQEQAELSSTRSYRPQPSSTVQRTRSRRNCGPSCRGSNRMVPRSSGKIKYQDDATQTSHMFANVPSRRAYINKEENFEPQGQLSSISVQVKYNLESASLREFRIAETSPTATATPIQREFPITQKQTELNDAASSYRPQPSRRVRHRKCCLFRPASNRRAPRSAGKIKYRDDATQTSHIFAEVPSRRDCFCEVEDLEQEGQLSSVNYETVHNRGLTTGSPLYDQSPVTVVPPGQISRTSTSGLERSTSISELSIAPPRKRKITFREPCSDTSGEPQISFIMTPRGSRISRGTQTHYRRDASVQTSSFLMPSARSVMNPTQRTTILPVILEQRRSEFGPADFLHKTTSAEMKTTEYALTEKRGYTVASRPPQECYCPPIWMTPSDKEDQGPPDNDEELVEYHPPRVGRQRRRREGCQGISCGAMSHHWRKESWNATNFSDWAQQRSMRTYCLTGWVPFKIVELILLILCLAAAILFFDEYQVMAVKVRSLTTAVSILKWSALCLAIIVTIALLVFGYYKRRPTWCNLAAVAGTGFLIFASVGTYLAVVHHAAVEAKFSNITTFILTGIYLADMFYSLVMRGIERDEIKV